MNRKKEQYKQELEVQKEEKLRSMEYRELKM